MSCFQNMNRSLRKTYLKKKNTKKPFLFSGLKLTRDGTSLKVNRLYYKESIPSTTQTFMIASTQ